MVSSSEQQYVQRAIKLAQESVDKGGFPAGALIVKDGEIVSEGISIGFVLHDPTAHAETVAVRDACKKLETTNLEGAVLYESVECCLMCFSGAYWAGVSKIVFAVKKTPEMVEKYYYEGMTDVKAVNSKNNRQIELIHAQEFEQESLSVIQAWEQDGGFK